MSRMRCFNKLCHKQNVHIVYCYILQTFEFSANVWIINIFTVITNIKLAKPKLSSGGK